MQGVVSRFAPCVALVVSEVPSRFHDATARGRSKGDVVAALRCACAHSDEPAGAQSVKAGCDARCDQVYDAITRACAGTAPAFASGGIECSAVRRCVTARSKRRASAAPLCGRRGLAAPAHGTHLRRSARSRRGCMCLDPRHACVAVPPRGVRAPHAEHVQRERIRTPARHGPNAQLQVRGVHACTPRHGALQSAGGMQLRRTFGACLCAARVRWPSPAPKRRDVGVRPDPLHALAAICAVGGVMSTRARRSAHVASQWMDGLARPRRRTCARPTPVRLHRGERPTRR